MNECFVFSRSTLPVDRFPIHHFTAMADYFRNCRGGRQDSAVAPIARSYLQMCHHDFHFWCQNASRSIYSVHGHRWAKRATDFLVMSLWLERFAVSLKLFAYCGRAHFLNYFFMLHICVFINWSYHCSGLIELYLGENFWCKFGSYDSRSMWRDICTAIWKGIGERLFWSSFARLQV